MGTGSLSVNGDEIVIRHQRICVLWHVRQMLNSIWCILFQTTFTVLMNWHWAANGLDR
jgi:hypothetical protein